MSRSSRRSASVSPANFRYPISETLALDMELIDESYLENEKSYQRMIDSRGK